MAICEGLLGENEAMTENAQGTSESGKTPLSSEDMKKHLKDGEEPIEILLSLVSSPLIDLKGRALARIMTAEDGGRKIVLAIFYDATWDDEQGIIPSVGKGQAK
jgi:hypothetical protein